MICIFGLVWLRDIDIEVYIGVCNLIEDGYTKFKFKFELINAAWERVAFYLYSFLRSLNRFGRVSECEWSCKRAQNETNQFVWRYTVLIKRREYFVVIKSWMAIRNSVAFRSVSGKWTRKFIIIIIIIININIATLFLIFISTRKINV